MGRLSCLSLFIATPTALFTEWLNRVARPTRFPVQPRYTAPTGLDTSLGSFLGLQHSASKKRSLNASTPGWYISPLWGLYPWPVEGLRSIYTSAGRPAFLFLRSSWRHVGVMVRTPWVSKHGQEQSGVRPMRTLATMRPSLRWGTRIVAMPVWVRPLCQPLARKISRSASTLCTGGRQVFPLQTTA